MPETSTNGRSRSPGRPAPTPLAVHPTPEVDYRWQPRAAASRGQSGRLVDLQKVKPI
ncbi:MAG: hypothetical protein ACFB12_21420 [Leptolyngbyaceae cyanobacterium]